MVGWWWVSGVMVGEWGDGGWVGWWWVSGVMVGEWDDRVVGVWGMLFKLHLNSVRILCRLFSLGSHSAKVMYFWTDRRYVNALNKEVDVIQEYLSPFSSCMFVGTNFDYQDKISSLNADIYFNCIIFQISFFSNTSEV